MRENEFIFLDELKHRILISRNLCGCIYSGSILIKIRQKGGENIKKVYSPAEKHCESDRGDRGGKGE